MELPLFHWIPGRTLAGAAARVLFFFLAAGVGPPAAAPEDAASASLRKPDWAVRMEHANQLLEMGRWSEAEGIYASLAREARQAGDPALAGVAHYNLGRLLERLGEPRAAEKQFRTALHEFERAPDLDRRLVARAASGLAAAWLETNQLARAEALVRRILDHVPAEPQDRISLQGALAVVLARRGRFAEAESILREALAAGQAESAPGAAEAAAVAAANLAALELRAGRIAGSIQTGRRALELFESLPEPPLASVYAAALANFADALARAGDGPGAGQYYRKAAAVARERLGPKHAVLAHVLHRWAGFLRAAGQKAEARTLTQAARRIEAEWRRSNLAGYTADYQQMLVERRR